jgi:hypothetical protein
VISSSQTENIPPVQSGSAFALVERTGARTRKVGDAEDKVTIPTALQSSGNDQALAVLPQGVAQLLDRTPVDARAVDKALQGFLDKIDNIGDRLALPHGGARVLSWLLAGAVLAATARAIHRKARRSSLNAPSASLSDTSISWMTDAEGEESVQQVA